MDLKKFEERFNSLTNEIDLDIYRRYARDVGYAMGAEHDSLFYCDLNVIIVNALDSITDPERHGMLKCMDEMLFSFTSGKRKKEDDKARDEFLKEPLSVAVLAFMNGKGVVTTDDIRNGVPFSADKVNNTIWWLHEVGTIQCVGKGRFYYNV